MKNGKIKEKSPKMHKKGCLEELPPFLYEQKHRVPQWPGESPTSHCTHPPPPSALLEEILSHSLSGPAVWTHPQTGPPTRLFFTLIKTHQLYVFMCLLTTPLHHSLLTAPSPGAHTAPVPWSLPGDGVSITFRGAGTALTPPETTQGHGSCW